MELWERSHLDLIPAGQLRRLGIELSELAVVFDIVRGAVENLALT
jgi:hypothetical protein